MTERKILSKEQILKAIEQLEKTPNDKLDILADIGVAGLGAGGGGAAAFAFGGGVIPILFGLITIPVAAPLGVVAGAAVLGGAALVGAKRVLIDGTRMEGKKAEMLRQLKEQLREAEAKERASRVQDNDKKNFRTFLDEQVKLDLISSKDADDLIMAVETGQMLLTEATQLVQDVINSVK